MKSSRALSAFSLVVGSVAFWRMECRGRVGLARIDPMVSPGEVAQHVHAIHGSSGFSESATYDDLMKADCTSCAVVEDKSVYWTPALYFHHDNGTYELVQQTGGMLAYYQLNPNPGQTGNITAFPKGFRMIAGDSLRRNYSIPGTNVKDADPEKSFWAMLGQTSQTDLEQRALGFNCLNYQKAPEGALYRHYLPDKAYLDANCANGIRFELSFPSCWNGKDLDSKDHRSHVAYPDLVLNGNCPDDFPIRLPGLLYETIWESDAFIGMAGEFVISNGDVQGFGYHGDFIMGWDPVLLQNAVDQCTNPSGKVEDCPLFTIQSEDKQRQCSMKVPDLLTNEKVEGEVGNSLPGNVLIQYGPQPATLVNPPPQTTTLPVPTASYSPGSTPTYQGSVLPGQVFKDTHPTSSASQPTSSIDIGPLNVQVSPSAEVNPYPSPAAVNSTSSTSSDTAPAPTDPSSAQTSDESLPIVSTQYVTNGNIVSKIIWQEKVVYVTNTEDTTVTVTVTPSAGARKLRREDHAHHHRARHGKPAVHHH